MASTVTEATVAATPNAPNAMAFITPTDANAVTDGHQVRSVGGQKPRHDQGHFAENGTIRTYTGQHQPGRHRQLRLEGRGRPGRAACNWQQDKSYTEASPKTTASSGSRPPDPEHLPHTSRTGHASPPATLTCTAPTTTHHTCGRTGRPSGSVTQQPSSCSPTGSPTATARKPKTSHCTPTTDAANRNLVETGQPSGYSNITQARLYAYALDGGARQESREFDLHSSNEDSQGNLVRRVHHVGRRHV